MTRNTQSDTSNLSHKSKSSNELRRSARRLFSKETQTRTSTIIVITLILSLIGGLVSIHILQMLNKGTGDQSTLEDSFGTIHVSGDYTNHTVDTNTDGVIDEIRVALTINWQPPTKGYHPAKRLITVNGSFVSHPMEHRLEVTRSFSLTPGNNTIVLSIARETFESDADPPQEIWFELDTLEIYTTDETDHSTTRNITGPLVFSEQLGFLTERYLYPMFLPVNNLTTEQGVDLTIEDITWSRPDKSDNPQPVCGAVQIAAEVNNVGSYDVNEPFNVSFYVNESLLQTVTVESLGQQTTRSVTAHYFSHAPETVRIRAIADREERIIEKDELNNDLATAVTFPEEVYTLTVETVGAGNVQRSLDRSKYLCGQTIQLTAVPAPGWTFHGWVGDHVSTDNPLAVVMDRQVRVIAQFMESPGNPDNRIKVMEYNIEAGGENPDWKAVVTEENPDILVCIETGDWDDNNNQKLDAIVQEFNTHFLTINETPYTGVTTEDIPYPTSGVAVLSRYPVSEVTQLPVVVLDDGSTYDVTHDFLDVELSLHGTPIHVIGGHLKAIAGDENEWRREREMEGIINYMDILGDVPIIFTGDFNTFSPEDSGDLAPRGNLGHGPITMLLYPSDPDYGQYSSSIQTFIDSYRTLEPTSLGFTYGHQNAAYTSRIDFIMVNSYFGPKLLNSTTGDTPHADTGSDHYSVDLVMDWAAVPEPEPPGRVTGLNTIDQTASRIELRWNEETASDFLFYKIYRDGREIARAYENMFSDTHLEGNTTYRYEVTAVDNGMIEGAKSAALEVRTKGVAVADASSVMINEFLPDPYQRYDEEWIELYNPGDDDVDLSGCLLDDLRSGGTGPYTIPTGTIIPAHGFLVFRQDITGIGLNNNGDTVNLIAPDQVTIIDSYSYDTSTDDSSFGRETDGNGVWIVFQDPTPGFSNMAGSN